MTAVPVMLLVLFFMLWELQVYPKCSCVWVSMWDGKKPHVFRVLYNSTPCLMTRIEPLRTEHSLPLPRPFS